MPTALAAISVAWPFCSGTGSLTEFAGLRFCLSRALASSIGTASNATAANWPGSKSDHVQTPTASRKTVLGQMGASIFGFWTQEAILPGRTLCEGLNSAQDRPDPRGGVLPFPAVESFSLA